MVGLFSFLFLVSLIALAVAVVLLVVRAVKKKPKKPVAVVAGVSLLVCLVSFVVIGTTYQPTPEQIAERERVAAEKAERERLEAEAAAQREAEAAQSESQTPTAEPSAPSESPEQSELSEPDSPSVPAESEPPAESENPAHSDAPATSSTAPSEPEEPSAPAEPEPDFIDEHRTDIVVSAKMVLDGFVTNYKIPLATQLWTIAKFDNEGAIAAMADITEKSTDATVIAVVVLTPVMDGESMTGATPHYVSVGDTVYGDDGYCDDVFSLLEGIGSSQ